MTGALLAEEVLPGTDVLPSATIAFFAQEAEWLKENGLRVDEMVGEVARKVMEKGLENFNEGMRATGVTVAVVAGGKDGAPMGRTMKRGFWS